MSELNEFLDISPEDASSLVYEMGKGRGKARLNDVGEVLTTQEAAEFLRIDKKLLYKLIDSGQLKAKRLGRVYRISKTALNEFLTGETNE
jgi:excisionase family DNA binding protein